MPRKAVNLAPEDTCKVLICEMTVPQIDSVISYATYWRAQMLKREKQLAKEKKEKEAQPPLIPTPQESNHNK